MLPRIDRSLALLTTRQVRVGVVRRVVLKRSCALLSPSLGERHRIRLAHIKASADPRPGS
jgi:hypothetical protein